VPSDVRRPQGNREVCQRTVPPGTVPRTDARVPWPVD